MADSSSSQTMRAVLGLRGMIVDGLLSPGDRISEPMLVERFGVSRTPARAALAQLAVEGMIEARETTGYAVRGFTEADVYHGIAIRGSLEGLAARYAAEREVPGDLLDQLDQCVGDLDAVVYTSDEKIDQQEYARLNDRFHRLLRQASGSDMVVWTLERLDGLPFAAPNAFVDSLSLQHERVRRILQSSQEQHRVIAEAIRLRDPVRAQAVATEHSNGAAQYLKLLKSLKDQEIPWVTSPTKKKARRSRV
ncbi:MAG: GntR family transcriptional regulator [Paracoccus denitrificans]|uniref:GntR family transcriptional regulator n=1 Tax=Paracoccus denitrificans TaxID=266 RepID=A0A533I1Y6_PARDE|nr:MAG: GntR family transcriptional regulator [Paracoccus denitrificans]